MTRPKTTKKTFQKNRAIKKSLQEYMKRDLLQVYKTILELQLKKYRINLEKIKEIKNLQQYLYFKTRETQ